MNVLMVAIIVYLLETVRISRGPIYVTVEKAIGYLNGILKDV